MELHSKTIMKNEQTRENIFMHMWNLTHFSRVNSSAFCRQPRDVSGEISGKGISEKKNPIKISRESWWPESLEASLFVIMLSMKLEEKKEEARKTKRFAKICL